MADDVRTQNEVRRDTLPGTNADGALGYGRANRYGEQVNYNVDRNVLADEGSYYVATNATPGTAIASIAAADGYDDTEALFYLGNTHASKHVYMDYLHLVVKVAGANGTDFAYAIDVATEATWASGGTAITPVDVNRETNNTAPVTCYFGAVVTTTGTTEKLMSHGQLTTVIKVIGDHYLFTFGQPALAPATTIMEAGAQHSVQRSCPPIVIPPAHAMSFRDFCTSQSGAAQWQFEAGFWVR